MLHQGKGCAQLQGNMHLFSLAKWLTTDVPEAIASEKIHNRGLLPCRVWSKKGTQCCRKDLVISLGISFLEGQKKYATHNPRISTEVILLGNPVFGLITHPEHRQYRFRLTND